MPPIYFKVQVWIFRKTSKQREYEFLLLKTNAARGAFWQPVTGGVEKDEPIETAALREAQEETHLAPFGPLIPLHCTFAFDARGKTFEEHCFALQAQSTTEGNSKLKLDPREHDEFQWVSAQTALGLLRHESNARSLRSLEEYLKKSPI